MHVSARDLRCKAGKPPKGTSPPLLNSLMKIRTLKLLALLVVGGATAVWAQTEPARGPAQMQPCSGLSSLKVPLAPEHVDPATGKLISRDHLPMRVDIGRYTNLRA